MNVDDLAASRTFRTELRAMVDRNLEILKVAFPMRDVVSARLFDRELYVSFLDTQTATS